MRSSPSKDGARQVDFRDQALAGQGQVADRGELVEVHVAVARFLQGELGAPQLLVLHLQLDLVHLELVQELLGGLRRRTRVRGAGKLRLCLRPQP